MTELEKQRLEDFKKVLTYHLVTKIRHWFNGNCELYYKAPKLWDKWRKREIAYDKVIYKLIILFNRTALSAAQVQCIFGKDENKKWLHYSKLIAQDKLIDFKNKGTVIMKKRRYQFKKRYMLPEQFIKSIFDNPSLLNKVINAKSKYYTNRQRRLIFTQILGKKNNYHYKTAEENDAVKIVDELTPEELADLGLDIPK